MPKFNARHLLRKIDRRVLYFFIGFFVLRVFLFNFNAAEWGDSYSILRMADFLRDLRIPLDEKRLPLFSVSLIPGFYITSPIFWGRLVVLLSSFLVLVLTLNIHKILYPKSKNRLMVLLLTLFNPIFLYWSIRIMADIFFAVFALGSLVFFHKKCKSSRSSKSSLFDKNVLLLAFIVSLASLTRFEGFLLVPGFILFYLYKRNFKAVVSFLLLFTFVVGPWFFVTKYLLKAGASSAYIEEASRFVFDFKRFRFFALSYVFAFGFPPAFLFYAVGLRDFLTDKVRRDIFVYLPILSFLILETALSLYWTPSVPRILLPIIPLMIIFFVEGLSKYLNVKLSLKAGVSLSVLSSLFVGFYAYGQYIERTHFLVLSKTGLVLVVVMSALAAVLFLLMGWRRKAVFDRGFLTLIFLGLFISNFVILVNHRRHFLPTLKASNYARLASISIGGKVAYSDETGVSRWVLDRGNVGYKLPKYAVQFGDIHAFLRSRGITHIVWSNEFERFSSFWWIVDNKEESIHFKMVYKAEEDISDKLDLWMDKFLGTNLVDKRWIQEARVYRYTPYLANSLLQ